MIRYLTMISFTQKGLENVSLSVDRAGQFQERVAKLGGRVLHQYWSFGEYDGCLVFEVPDESAAAALLLSLGKDANVRTKSVRVFNNSEFETILKHVS